MMSKVCNSGICMNERKLASSKKWPKCTMFTFTTSLRAYFNVVRDHA